MTQLYAFAVMTFSLHGLVVVSLSVGATILFHFYSIKTDMPLSIIATAVFFPISMGISYNFNRRERVLLVREGC